LKCKFFGPHIDFESYIMTNDQFVFAHTGKTALAGVIGWPIAHSQSPRLHGFWLNKYGIDGAYLPLAVQPDQIEAALKGLIALGFRGANVTIPYKEKVIPFLDSISPLAQKIGAVNTLVITDGKIHGTNTDAPGYIANLRAQAPTWSGKGCAVVLGAGGAARGICAALADAGVDEIVILNRTVGKAADLAENLQDLLSTPIFAKSLTADIWAEIAPTCDLLVNTTSLGMVNHPPLVIDLSGLPKHAVVSDIVYAPLDTDLLKAARAKNLATVDGLGMLLYQAREGFHAWFGTQPDVTSELRDFVIRGL